MDTRSTLLEGVPQITTALTGPLPDLERRILHAMPAIESWLRGKWLEHVTPFYTSVDLRNCGFKIAPIDTNLYPGGFNNLNPEFDVLCLRATRAAIEASTTMCTALSLKRARGARIASS